MLASARDVNVLVLDTEVYSNTGGQASKATPLGAIAKFAAAGKRVARKDLALQAIAYGNVYVAQIAMGANPQQTLHAFREAEAYPGPSLILAYCHCIAHGIDMQLGMKQQDLAVACGYWPLFRYNPALREVGEQPVRAGQPAPNHEFRDFAYNETRYRALAQSRPEEAELLMAAAQAALEEKYRSYEEMAGWSAARFHPAGLRNSGIAGRGGRARRRRCGNDANLASVNDYDLDIYAWSQRQGALLRRLAAGEHVKDLDWPNIAEAIETVGRSERAALRSHILNVIEHLMKLQASLAVEPRAGWQETIDRARSEIEDLLNDSPSLHTKVSGLVTKMLPKARRFIDKALTRHGETARVPLATITYDEEQVLSDWFPDQT